MIFLKLPLLFQTNRTSDVLRVAVLPVIDLSVCKNAYENGAQLGDYLTENMFCAGGSVNGQATYRVSIYMYIYIYIYIYIYKEKQPEFGLILLGAAFVSTNKILYILYHFLTIWLGFSVAYVSQD